MKDKKVKKVSKNSRSKKPHYKKQVSGIYNKRKTTTKKKAKNQQVESTQELLALRAEPLQQEPELLTQLPEADAVKAEPTFEGAVDAMVQADAETADALQSDAASPEQDPDSAVEPEQAPAEQQAPKKPMTASFRLLLQAALALMFSFMGVAVLLGTVFFVYMPVKASNKSLADQRLQARMELSLMIADVFPSMSADDELTDVVKRALENKKANLRKESAQVEEELKTLYSTDEQIGKLLTDVGYDTVNLAQVIRDESATAICLNAIQVSTSSLDVRLEALGVAKLKEEIAQLKGTTTTVTREDENGQVITETVVSGGLVPEAQAKKNELQKKYDDIKTKLDELDAYLDDNKGKITTMYNRLESDQKTHDTFGKMEAITNYVKENPDDNIFLDDTLNKLASFPGESKEEDDILFIMKVESETGIRMQTVNYGQDYQHKKLSNGMLLCYEVYSIPYYATYQGLKNLIAYFNDNDDFYASIYTLSIQYNAANQTIQGNMVILHYYLLDEDAEYIPPVIDEEIIPGIDGIFGEVTDNGKTQGKQSPYSVDDVKAWLDDGMTFEQVRDKLKSEGYPATELAWILKEEYKTYEEMQGFLEEYGEEGKEYDLNYVLDLMECDLSTLMEIYYASDPDDDEEDDQTPDDSEGGQKPGNTSGKQSDYTAADIEAMLDSGMSLDEVRDQIKSEGYPATELAWILKEKYDTRAEIGMFVVEYGGTKYLTSESAVELFECSEAELLAIYNS